MISYPRYTKLVISDLYYSTKNTEQYSYTTLISDHNSGDRNSGGDKHPQTALKTSGRHRKGFCRHHAAMVIDGLLYCLLFGMRLNTLVPIIWHET